MHVLLRVDADDELAHGDEAAVVGFVLGGEQGQERGGERHTDYPPRQAPGLRQ